MLIKERIAVEYPEQLAAGLINFIRDTVEREGRRGCVLGNSGGIDSALVAFLAVRALGKDKVKLLFLPERDTHKDSFADARLLAKALDMPLETINITPVLRKLGIYKLEPPVGLVPVWIREKYARDKRKSLEGIVGNVFLAMLRGGENSELQRAIAYLSAKNRVRMSLLYKQAELSNSLVLGTTNLSEKMTGLFIKYGDGAGDLAPIEKLYKTQVYELSKYLGVPDRIVKKKPIGDLIPSLTDADTLKIGYDRLDGILAGLELGLSQDAIASQAGVSRSEIDYVMELVSAASSMRLGTYVPS